MDSCAGKVVYCCVWRNKKILCSYNAGGDHTLDTLAAQCLHSPPVYHSHYLHTVGTRTFAFLLDGTEVYFAILDPNRASPKSAILKLLHQIRDGFRNDDGCRRDGEELVAVIRRLVLSLEQSTLLEFPKEEEEEEERNGDSMSSTKALLTGGDGVEVRMEVAEVEASGDLLQQKRRFARELWWRHFKIVVAVDAGVCLLLFGIWLAVCRGLQCVS